MSAPEAHLAFPEDGWELDFSGHKYDPNCGECFHGETATCSECGLKTLHQIFGDESWEDYWLYYFCHNCGSTDPD